MADESINFFYPVIDLTGDSDDSPVFSPVNGSTNVPNTLLPSKDVSEGTALLDTSCCNSSVKPPTPDSTVQNDPKKSEESSRFKYAVDYNFLKRVLEKIAPLSEIVNPAIAGTGRTTETEDNVSVEVAEDVTYLYSSKINHESVKGTERCCLNNSVTPSTKQSNNYEAPPKRPKIINDFPEINIPQGTSNKISIDEYKTKKYVFPDDNLWATAASQESDNRSLSRSSSAFSSTNSSSCFASPSIQTFSQSVPAGNLFSPSHISTFYLPSASPSRILTSYPPSASPSHTIFSTPTINTLPLPSLNSGDQNNLTNLRTGLFSTSTQCIGHNFTTLKKLPPSVVKVPQLMPPPIGQLRHTIPSHSASSNSQLPARHVTSHNYQRFFPSSSSFLDLRQSAVQTLPSFFQAPNSCVFPGDNLWAQNVESDNSSLSRSSFTPILRPSPVYKETNYGAMNATRVATKISRGDKQGISLFSSSLNSDIGTKYIVTADIYLIIVGWSVEWMLVLTKVEAESPFSSFLRQTRNSYGDLVTYYNTYLPLLLLRCWKKVYTALLRYERKKSQNRREWQWEIKECDRKETFIDILCEIIIPKNDEAYIPREGDVILVSSPLYPKDAIKMLAYVHSSQHRAYYEKCDRRHKTIKNLKPPFGNLSKIKISCYVVFNADFSNLEFIKVSKLTNVKTLLKQNDALLDLAKSPLFKIVLDPPNHDILKICLPRNENSALMCETVRQLSGCLQTPFEQVILLTYTLCSDATSILVQLTDELKKSQHRPKTLICVDNHLLDSVGLCLLDLQTFVILDRERDGDLHQQLQSFSFDEMLNKRRNSTGVEKNVAQFQVLKACDVILAITTNCFYKDIADVLSSELQLEICIIFQAHHFTESETILPLQYGSKKLILIGDSDASCEVGSVNYDYHQSLFFRVYNAC